VKGNTVIITGANGALGRAVVAEARARNAEVVAIDLSFGDTDTGCRQIELDLTDADAVKQTIGGLERVDALLNIAGGFAMGPTVHETNPDEWHAMFSMNVVTMRNMCDAVVPRMLDQGSGRIVNVGALSAREGQGNMGAYVVAKSAVMRLTETMAKELRQHGVNVNAVLPSIIDTPTNRADMPDANHSKWVDPADLARVICFLGSADARAMHGALVPVCGLS
jgi:NAD(P)-dependent dehydrogenase (short-subunit alcohol dehydrogenase family)